MPTPPLSDKLAVEAAAAFREHGSISSAATALGVPRGTMANRIRHARERGLLMTEVRVTETNDASGALKSRSVTSKQLGEVWEPPEDWRVSRLSVLTDAEGREVQRWTRTSPQADHLAAMVEAAKDAIAEAEPLAPVVPPTVADDDLCTVLMLADVHLGQLSWKEETGEDWSLKRAVKYVSDTASCLVGATPPSGTAVVLVLGDYLHADDSTAQTPTNRHPLDVDSRHALVMRSAVDLALSLVSMALHRHQHVLVRVLPGNHDIHAAPAVGLALWAAYREEPRVTVDLDPSLFWWLEHGRVLIGATHGHTVKLQELPLLMASSVPDAWGRTSYRTIFSGHRHHQTTHEAGGVVCRCLPPVTARDAYAAGRGYHASRGMTATTYHKETGPWMELQKIVPPPTTTATRTCGSQSTTGAR